MRNLKEMSNSLGSFGSILYYSFIALISVLPFVMIDTNFIMTFLYTLLQILFPFSTVIFWIWGLIAAIKGIQDVYAIVYYIAFAILWLPSFIYMLISFFKRQ